MAKETINLKLILPGNNEFYNAWDKPVNANFTTLDTVVGNIQGELVEARGSAATLTDRLDVAMGADGSLLPTAEVIKARSSSIYGSFDSLGNPLSLSGRIEQVDREVFTARESLTSLRDSLAWGADQNTNNSIVSGPVNYLTYTGAIVTLHGATAPIYANINGYRQVARTDKATTISGAASTYYITLSRVPAGELYLTSTTGVIATYAGTGKIAKLSDVTKNFVALGVKPGDVLEVTAPVGNPNIEKYVVVATNTEDGTNLTTSELAVYGQFVSASSGVTYTITNPIAPSLGFESAAHAKTFTRVDGKIYIGRCVFNGTNITSLTTYQPNGRYADFTSVTLVSGDFDLTIAHNLGYFPKKVSIYASQASDFSAPMDLLSVAGMTSSTLDRSVLAQVSDTSIRIKNATNGLFYKDIGGTSQTAGYLYVVVER